MASKTKFKKLSDQDKSYIQTTHSNNDLGWDQRMSILMNKFDVSERTIRRWIKKLGFSSHKEIENEEVREGKTKIYNKKKKYFIFTWAQNATPVHKPFWDNVLAYANHIDAEIGVIQGRYQNPTSIWSANMESSEWWDTPLRQYLDGGRHNLHQYLDIVSDVKIRPTAVNPLSGFETISSDRSSIFGHPKVHFRSLPVFKGHPNKMLLTTGACTIKNYTDSKAGKKAEFHHTYGFIIVEIKDDLTFYIRQVTAEDTGCFTDLNKHVSGGKVEKINRISAYVFGDIHVSSLQESLMPQTSKLLKVLKPNHVVLHDVFDGESVNHHESNNPIAAYQRRQSGKDSVLKELDEVYRFIDQYNLIKYRPIVVRSNHDEWLDKWIIEGNWKKDITNSKEYLEYALLLLTGRANKGLLPYLLDQRYGSKIITLDKDDSYKINGWELGQHGHLGVNGSRATAEQYRKLNTKVIIGHSHIPDRRDGVVQVGTYTKLKLNYTFGPSSWMHSGAILHTNGKVQHIIFQEDNKFTTFKEFN